MIAALAQHKYCKKRHEMEGWRGQARHLHVDTKKKEKRGVEVSDRRRRAHIVSVISFLLTEEGEFA